MRAFILSQIPNAHIPTAIAADQLTLIRMDDHIVDRRTMGIVALHAARPRIPNLDRTVFGASDHPFSLAVKCNSRNVRGVAFEGEDGVWVRRFDLVELDGMVSSGGKKAFVGGDTEAINLRVWMRDCARADAGEGLPEANRMVVAGYGLLALP
jgi:hypothetical protein